MKDFTKWKVIPGFNEAMFTDPEYNEEEEYIFFVEGLGFLFMDTDEKKPTVLKALSYFIENYVEITGSHVISLIDWEYGPKIYAWNVDTKKFERTAKAESLITKKYGDLYAKWESADDKVYSGDVREAMYYNGFCFKYEEGPRRGVEFVKDYWRVSKNKEMFTMSTNVAPEGYPFGRHSFATYCFYVKGIGKVRFEVSDRKDWEHQAVLNALTWFLSRYVDSTYRYLTVISPLQSALEFYIWSSEDKKLITDVMRDWDEYYYACPVGMLKKKDLTLSNIIDGGVFSKDAESVLVYNYGEYLDEDRWHCVKSLISTSVGINMLCNGF